MRYKVKATFERNHLEHGKLEKGVVREYEFNAGSEAHAREELNRRLTKDETTLQKVTSVDIQNLGVDK